MDKKVNQPLGRTPLENTLLVSIMKLETLEKEKKPFNV